MPASVGAVASSAVGIAVTLLPGDGIGPEVSTAARRALDATGVEIDWDEQPAGSDLAESGGERLPAAALESVRASGLALKGPMTTPLDAPYASVNSALRRELDLFASVRPCRAYPGVPTPFPDTDIVVFRENTEDVFSGHEFSAGSDGADELRALAERAGRPLPVGAAVTVKVISPAASERIARAAFDFARANDRRRVTVAHKANVMKATDGLFLECARRVAGDYPGVELEDRLVDELCSRMAWKPAELDVILAPNLYGDILADIGAALIGGPGMAAGANHGDRVAVFEAGHGSAPPHAGRDSANPLGLILSGVLLLRHAGEADAAARLEAAVAAVTAEGVTVTADLRAPGDGRPAAGTQDVADAVVRRLGHREPSLA